MSAPRKISWWVKLSLSQKHKNQVLSPFWLHKVSYWWTVMWVNAILNWWFLVYIFFSNVAIFYVQIYTGFQERSSPLANAFRLQLNKKIVVAHHHLGLIFGDTYYSSLLFLLNRYSVLWKHDDGQNEENAIQVSINQNYLLPKHYNFPSPSFSELWRAWVDTSGTKGGKRWK